MGNNTIGEMSPICLNIWGAVKKWQNYVSVIILIKLCFDFFVYYSCLMFIVLHKNLQAAFDLLVAQR